MIPKTKNFDAITSVLDKEDAKFIFTLHQELIDAGYTYKRFENFFPHITYSAMHFAAKREQVEPALDELAEQTSPFTAEITGLGIFTGEVPVLYMQVVRRPQLNRLQHDIAESLAPYAAESNPHFEPTAWSPHLTIGWPKGPDELGKAVQLLCQRDLRCEILIDNITILFSDDNKPPRRFDLKGK